MDESMKWIIGLMAAVLGTIVTALITAIHNTRQSQSAAASALHKRIDDVHRDYVRRDDYSEFKNDVRESLHRIEDKLDKAMQTGKS